MDFDCYTGDRCSIPTHGDSLGDWRLNLHPGQPKYLRYGLLFIFADDTALIYVERNPKALQKRINIDMKLLLKWLKANKISLNVDKTEIIIFKHKLKKMMENAWYSKIVSTCWEF